MRCNFFSNFLRVTFERKVLRLTNTVSRFAGDYSSRVSGKGEDDVGGEIGKEKRTEGKGPWLGSPRHWGPGRDGIHRLAVLVYRGSLRSSYYAPLLVPHLARQTLLSFLPPPPASVAWTTRGLSLSLSRGPPRTYPVLFVSVTGKWPLQTGTTILHSLSLSLYLPLFRFHLLSPYNSPTAFIKSRVYLWT